MPELAEVILITKTLKPLINLNCTHVKLISGKLKQTHKEIVKSFSKQLPKRIKSIQSRGKFIWIEFNHESDTKSENDDLSHIGFALGLVGKLTLSGNDKVNKHDRIIFTFNGLYLTFNDYRNFGNVYIRTHDEHIIAMKKIGPALNTLNHIQFTSIYSNTKKGNKVCIVKVLLDQSIISGIGNYMRNDALYYARIDPHKLKGKLDNNEYKRLYNGLIKVFNWALDNQLNEVNYKKKEFAVYKQKTDPKGRHVLKETMASRSIFWVPSIQC